ncbi:MAG: dihydroneopterin aldolase [Candidatus Latescibacterota bacterium]
MGILRLKGMVFFAYHGVLPEERKLGQQFEVDVEMAYEMAPAADSDRVEHAINYQAVYDVVQGAVAGEAVQLLEALATRIAETVMARFPAERTSICVRKMHPPIPGFTGCAEVEVARRR